MTATIVKNGAVSLAKALMDHEVWHLEPFSRGQAWVDLILAANDANRTFLAQGRPVEVFRGQTGYSLKSLARRWKWSDEKVAGFILWLERGGMISRKSTGVTTLITVLNYETYNSPRPDTEKDGETATGADTETATGTATGTEQKVEVGSKEEGNTPRWPRDLPVELPEGFPPTLEDALAQSAVAGVEPDAVAEIWHSAMAQNGTNWRGQPIRRWSHHVQAEALRLKAMGRGKKPSENGALPGRAGGSRAKSLGAEIMDAENTRKRTVAQMAEHPCNELSASYDAASEEYPAWQALLVTLRSVEGILRSIPKDAPDDWQRRLRAEAFQRELAQHPGNPESTAYDEAYCTPARQAEFLALRKEAV